MYRFYLKRIVDLYLAIILLIFLTPFLIIISAYLYCVNKGKIFFMQERLGLNNKIFWVLKFQTMTEERDLQGNLLPDKERLTRFGKYIRATSLDELPQLINVLRGSMSLVGPRPLLPQYLPLYSQMQIRRHEVRPGITGWAQVNGRNNISWGKKFELDVWYVDHLSFWLDMKIIFLTIGKVLKRDGVSKEGMATTEPFNGYN